MSLPHFPPEPAMLVLPAQCNTAAAPALKASLLAMIADEAAPAIDAGAVETMGQSALQLLLAATLARPDLRIAPVSPAFAEKVAACALGAKFGLEPRKD